MEKLLLEKMRKIYTKRLLEALKEVDVFDKEGNVLISKDLKVVHKDSGYEYTVDDVVKTDDGVKFVLREPDEPRFDAPPSLDMLDELDIRLKKYLEPREGESNPLQDEDIFIVDEESFEKEYEVK